MEQHKISSRWNHHDPMLQIIAEKGTRTERAEAKGIEIDLGAAVSHYLDKLKTRIDVDSLPDGPPPKEVIPIEDRIWLLKKRVFLSLNHICQMEDKRDYRFEDEYGRDLPGSKGMTLKQLFHELTLYFLGISTFFDPEKGLLFAGAPGVGKSIILRAFSMALDKYPIEEEYESKMNFLFKPVSEMCSEFNTMDNDAKEEYYLKYGKNIINNNLCPDDLGKEEFEKLYQFKQNPVKNIFNLRYDRRRHGTKTHATTNFDMDELTELYGPALVDRFYQMFNIIEFESVNSFRR